MPACIICSKQDPKRHFDKRCRTCVNECRQVPRPNTDAEAPKTKSVKSCADTLARLASSETAPTAEDYRMDPQTIDTSKCVGRKGLLDKNWSPHILLEYQCSKDVFQDGLCKACYDKDQNSYGASGAKAGANGRVDEDPPFWTHMLGTEWADKRMPVWKKS